MNYVHIVLHLASIVASLAAGFLWMRSASVPVPPIALGQTGELLERSDLSHWVSDMAQNLDEHRASLQLATKYNMAAAASAAIAAMAQATVFALDLLNNLMQL